MKYGHFPKGLQMDGNCSRLLRALMIATGHTEVVVTDEDLKQADQWELKPMTKIGGQGIADETMIVTIMERSKSQRQERNLDKLTPIP